MMVWMYRMVRMARPLRLCGDFFDRRTWLEDAVSKYVELGDGRSAAVVREEVGAVVGRNSNRALNATGPDRTT